MTFPFSWFWSYNNELVNALRVHPARDRIEIQLGKSMTIDEIIAILCRNLGLNAATWSSYTSSLDPPVHNYQDPISLQGIDSMLDNFHSRFGTIFVASDKKATADLKLTFNIVVFNTTEYNILKRQAENLSKYVYSGPCVVIGQMGECEVALYMVNGAVASLTINSAPLQFVMHVFIVGFLAQQFPSHLQTCSGEQIDNVDIIRKFYRRQKVSIIRDIQVNGTRTSLDCWFQIVSEPTFILFAQKLGRLLARDTGAVLAVQQHEELHRDFVVRCLQYRTQR